MEVFQISFVISVGEELTAFGYASSGVASPEIGGGMFDFRRITLFCLENGSQSTK